MESLSDTSTNLPCMRGTHIPIVVSQRHWSSVQSDCVGYYLEWIGLAQGIRTSTPSPSLSQLHQESSLTNQPCLQKLISVRPLIMLIAILQHGEASNQQQSQQGKEIIEAKRKTRKVNPPEDLSSSSRPFLLVCSRTYSARLYPISSYNFTSPRLRKREYRRVRGGRCRRRLRSPWPETACLLP
jgi:hypothetical protein